MDANPSRLNLYDRNGEPISHARFVELFNTEDYAVLRQDQTPDKRFIVSTVWLGINHRFMGAGPVLTITLRTLLVSSVYVHPIGRPTGWSWWIGSGRWPRLRSSRPSGELTSRPFNQRVERSM